MGHSLPELIAHYLSTNRTQKESTRNWIRQAWKLLVKLKGPMPVSDFGYGDAEDFQAYLYDHGYKPRTIIGYTKAVQGVMNWAWLRGYRQGDPFGRLKHPKIAQEEIRVFTQAELHDMLASAPTEMGRARILTAATAGLRRSEVLNLTVRDIDFDKGYIKVQAKKQTADTWEYGTKSYESRRVPLTESLSKSLAEIMLNLPDGQPYLMLSPKRYWWLQQLRYKRTLKERVRTCPDENFSRWFQRILSDANIADGSFHDLRKTCISHWTWSGLAAQEVQKLAGHADIKTTMLYYAGVRTDVLRIARSCSIV